jgi:phosphatidylinositol alpha 1,6-mannosyltransferase
MTFRLQIYTPYYAPSVGGIERHVETVSGELSRRGVEVWVTTLDVLPGGIRRRRDDATHRPDKVNGVAVRYLRTRNFAPSVYWPEPLVEKGAFPDVFHIHGFTAPEKIRLMLSAPKVPAVLTPHGSFLPRPRDRRAWIHLPKRLYDPVLNSRSIRAFDRVIAISARERTGLERLRPKHPAILLPNPLNADDFLIAPVAPGSSGRFLFLGRIGPEKRLDDLLKAAAEIGAETPIDIVGPDGGALASLKELVTRLGLSNVRFFGPATGEPKRTLLRQAIALVAPGEFEVNPLVCLEALAQGTPVIAPSTIAVDLPPGGTIGYPDRDISALAKAMIEVEGEGYSRRRTAAEATGQSIPHIEQYTDHLIAIYESMLADVG